MTLKHLKIFICVCKHNSITKAGKELFIAQPSISVAIKELEEHYGVQLFDRINKRLHITYAGKELLGYATHIIDLYATMEQKISNLHESTTIKVGTSVTIANHMLVEHIQRFKDIHKNTEIEVTIDNSNTIQQLLLSNQIDIAFLETGMKNNQVIEHPFNQDELVFVCAKYHPFANRQISLAELENQSLILREVGSSSRNVLESFFYTNQISFKPAWASTSTTAIIKAVQSNLGISFLPLSLIKDDVNTRISTFRIIDTHFSRNFCIAHLKNKYLSTNILDFMHLCK